MKLLHAALNVRWNLALFQALIQCVKIKRKAWKAPLVDTQCVSALSHTIIILLPSCSPPNQNPVWNPANLGGISFWTRVVLLIRKFQPLKDAIILHLGASDIFIWYDLIDSSPQPISRYDLSGPPRSGREYTPLRELPDEGAKFEWCGGLSVFGGPRPCLQCCQLPATFGIWWRQYEGKDTVSPVPILVWSLGIKQKGLQ